LNIAQPWREAAPLRQAPHNLQAEQALLGAVLVNNEAFEKVSAIIEPEHLFDPLHQRIYEAFGKLRHQGRVVTFTTLAPFFEAAEPISPTLTVPQYLGTLAASATTIINAPDYAKTIRDLATRRALIIIGEDLVNNAYDSPVDLTPRNQIEEVEGRLYQLASDGHENRRSFTITEAAALSLKRANDAYASGGGLAGLRTGLGTLDRKTGGLSPGHLIIVAGRPGMGKTAIATNIAQNIAAGGSVVGFYSLEMDAIDISDRILARMSGVPAAVMNDGRYSQDQMAAWMEAAERLKGWPLRIDDTSTMSIQHLAASARRMKRKYGLDVLIVDYLQKLSGVAYRGGKGDGNRVQEITEVSGGLKAIAKDLQVPVVALSQLSRQVENRENKRPQLSDLRDSGSIEQDADVVLFPYRDAYYLENDPVAFGQHGHDEWQDKLDKARNVAEVAIAKHRHRSTGNVTLGFIPELTSFHDMDEVRA
jgi:replicative DNA helicase